jgi:hypothetical protein
VGVLGDVPMLGLYDEGEDARVALHVAGDNVGLELLKAGKVQAEVATDGDNVGFVLYDKAGKVLWKAP